MEGITKIIEQLQMYEAHSETLRDLIKVIKNNPETAILCSSLAQSLDLMDREIKLLAKEVKFLAEEVQDIKKQMK